MSGRRLPALLAAAVLLLPATAEPHAALVRSSPAARAIVPDSPARVELWFNERLETAYSTVSVWSSGGIRVDRHDVLVGPDDPKRLSVGVFTLRPGEYTVKYRVLAIDGHVNDASFVFTVGLTSGR
ncbi:MAG: copper resistance protein CopC [Candidatus Rokubacteria bacterium]|nr:copper resistance protein CopC [Candidatus Rokubacteria bacterium]